MALGSGNNGNGGYSQREYNFYSKLRFTNRSENMSLSAAFWRNCLKITLSSELSEGNNVKYNELTSIYLSPVKAMVLKEVLEKWKLAPKSNHKPVGISTGMKEIQPTILFFNDADTNTRAMAICKVAPDGSINDKYVMHFNTADYHQSLILNNLDTAECEKEYHNDIEIDAFIMLLDQFAKAMTGAMAFSVYDGIRYDTNRMSNQLSAVMTALGVNQRSTYSTPNNSASNYFNNNRNNNGGGSSNESSTHRSIDDLEDID